LLPYPCNEPALRWFGFPLAWKIPRRFSAQIKHRGGAAESTSEEAIGESAGCSKIHELSDRVQLSGVCSVKLALAHRIASDRATAAIATTAVGNRRRRKKRRAPPLRAITRHRFLYATLFPSSNYSFLAEVNFKSRPVSADTGLPHSHPRFLPSRTIIYDCRPGFRLWFVVYRLYRPLFARHSLNQTWTGSVAIIGFARAVRLNVLCIRMAIKPLWIVAIHCVWIVIERLLWNTENID